MQQKTELAFMLGEVGGCSNVTANFYCKKRLFKNTTDKKKMFNKPTQKKALQIYFM